MEAQCGAMGFIPESSRSSHVQSDGKELEREKARIRREYEEQIRDLRDELEREKRRARMEREFNERENDFTERQQNARREVESTGMILELIIKAWEFASFIYNHFMKD
ncbi:GTPase IMAP family member 4-like [Mus pahari]|uniref:GTPase IMAP family member 4-like n=1 Tax=Mus pahari TaxID=10093 RepID=UPI000A30C6B8|nr:GTPase IMAP family member 4-like [Mus pahari]